MMHILDRLAGGQVVQLLNEVLGAVARGEVVLTTAQVDRLGCARFDAGSLETSFSIVARRSMVCAISDISAVITELECC